MLLTSHDLLKTLPNDELLVFILIGFIDMSHYVLLEKSESCEILRAYLAVVEATVRVAVI